MREKIHTLKTESQWEERPVTFWWQCCLKHLLIVMHEVPSSLLRATSSGSPSAKCSVPHEGPSTIFTWPHLEPSFHTWTFGRQITSNRQQVPRILSECMFSETLLYKSVYKPAAAQSHLAKHSQGARVLAIHHSSPFQCPGLFRFPMTFQKHTFYCVYPHTHK